MGWSAEARAMFESLNLRNLRWPEREVDLDLTFEGTKEGLDKCKGGECPQHDSVDIRGRSELFLAYAPYASPTLALPLGVGLTKQTLGLLTATSSASNPANLSGTPPNSKPSTNTANTTRISNSAIALPQHALGPRLKARFGPAFASKTPLPVLGSVVSQRVGSKSPLPCSGKLGCGLLVRLRVFSSTAEGCVMIGRAPGAPVRRRTCVPRGIKWPRMVVGEVAMRAVTPTVRERRRVSAMTASR